MLTVGMKVASALGCRQFTAVFLYDGVVEANSRFVALPLMLLT
jgi:hypothetical protein